MAGGGEQDTCLGTKRVSSSFPLSSSGGYFVPPSVEGKRTHCPRCEWLKLKGIFFSGLEIPGDSLHFAMKFSPLDETQCVPEEIRMSA